MRGLLDFVGDEEKYLKLLNHHMSIYTQIPYYQVSHYPYVRAASNAHTAQMISWKEGVTVVTRPVGQPDMDIIRAAKEEGIMANPMIHFTAFDATPSDTKPLEIDEVLKAADLKEVKTKQTMVTYLVQNPKEFDATLSGPHHRRLRNAQNRAEKNNWTVRLMTAVQSPIVDRLRQKWSAWKQKVDQSLYQASFVGMPTRETFELYKHANFRVMGIFSEDNTLMACAGFGQYNTQAAHVFRCHDPTYSGAMAALDIQSTKLLKEQGVSRLYVGIMQKQTPSLLHYKNQFGDFRHITLANYLCHVSPK
ncbi:MAG TPA: phosphatidylglycerol lysyltransferase domain-containing protein [Acidobacteriota bacterium]|nr:phosphatidylglycerol lysyltransferase domain-containing protein [Acidobacteriota bacterium]